MNYNLTFEFKGNRTYVHGTDIYNSIAEFTKNELGLSSLKNIKYTLNKVMRTNLIIEVFKNERVPKSADTCVVFLCKSDEDQYQFLLKESEKEIKSRYEYDEDALVKDCILNKEEQSLEMTYTSKYTDIELIVAINKAMMNLLFPEGPGKWYFTKLEIDHYINKSDYQSIKLKLIKNLNFKLTKSEIYIDGNLIGYIYFSSAA